MPQKLKRMIFCFIKREREREKKKNKENSKNKTIPFEKIKNTFE
jgi:hypothetical protein